MFGLLLAFMVLGERPGGWTGVGIALVLLAMWSVLTQPNAAPAVPTHLVGAPRIMSVPGDTGHPPGTLPASLDRPSTKDLDAGTDQSEG